MPQRIADRDGGGYPLAAAQRDVGAGDTRGDNIGGHVEVLSWRARPWRTDGRVGEQNRPVGMGPMRDRPVGLVTMGDH